MQAREEAADAAWLALSALTALVSECVSGGQAKALLLLLLLLLQSSTKGGAKHDTHARKCSTITLSSLICMCIRCMV